MILTDQDIEVRVSQISGTHIKRNNLRRKLKEQSNYLVTEKIQEFRLKIRSLRASGFKEEHLRDLYSEITKLEVQLL